MAVDFATYTAQGGQLDEQGFNSALPRAINAVKPWIIPHKPEEDQVAYDAAVIAAIDLIDEDVAVVSERVGNTSVTYRDAISPRGNAILNALSGSRLLYRGL